MISPEWVRAMARYNRWMNDKLYAAASTLPDADRKRDVGAFFRSIHGTFNHLLVADRIWLARFRRATLPDGDLGPGGIRTLDQELYSDFAELRSERARTDDDILAWAATLAPPDLEGNFVVMRRGTPVSTPMWGALAHAFNHQTHHRGQITTLLSQQGIDPGVTDLIAMLRESPPS